MGTVITADFGTQHDPIIYTDDDGEPVRFSQHTTPAEREVEAKLVDVLIERHGVPRSAIATMLDVWTRSSPDAVVAINVSDAEDGKILSPPLQYGLGMHDADRVELHMTAGELAASFAWCYDLFGATYHLLMPGGHLAIPCDHLRVDIRSNVDVDGLAERIVQHLRAVPAYREATGL